MFVLGNEVRGGSIYGSVPLLASENLVDGRDLPVTTDFRSLFSGIATQHLGIAKSNLLFPDWQGKPLHVLQG
jgi:uncharacterized protein (DUF1501 family)